MNYERIYLEFIADRVANPPPAGAYVERHHIKPRCMGGTNDPDNIVVLTAEDHIWAHLLLARAYRTPALWAAVLITFGGALSRARKAPTRREIRAAAEAREQCALATAGRPGRKLTEEEKQNLRMINRGKTRPDSVRARIRAGMELARQRGSVGGKPGPRDHTIYSLENFDGLTWSGTRTQMTEQLGIGYSLASCMILGVCRSAGGWFLAGNRHERNRRPGGNKGPVYTLRNLDTGEHWSGTKYEMVNALGIKDDNAYSITSGKCRRTGRWLFVAANDNGRAAA